MKSLLCGVIAVLLFQPLAVQAQSAAAAPAAFAPAGGAQGERAMKTLKRLVQRPYPPEGAWRYVSQAIGAYSTGDAATGDAAILGLKTWLAAQGEPKDDPNHEENGFHWQVYQIARILLLFGHDGVQAPGRMGADADKAAREMIWNWLAPRARAVLVDPKNDWWVWGSENHHLQAWFSMWGTLRVLASDPEYNTRTFSDGSTVPQLKQAFDAYFTRWIKNRATRGLLVECGSATYAKYSLPGFYNLADFADDPELKRLSREFLDLLWTQWALEQIDGIRAGSRHRSYRGSPSSEEGAVADLAWYHFGLGAPESAHPSVLCTITSSYQPPALVVEVAAKRRDLGTYEIASRQPGRADPELPMKQNYADDPAWPMFQKMGIYKLDAACRSMLRRIYATPGFILGATQVPALPGTSWTAISSQNRWDGVIFSGPGSPRIFIQPQGNHASTYNAQWAVQSKGVLLAQRLDAKDTLPATVWFSHSLSRVENGGWIFVEAPEAYAAFKVVDGGWKWEADRAEFWHSPASFKKAGGDWLAPEKIASPFILEVVPKAAYADFAAFQQAILANPLKQESDRVEYTSDYYKTTLTFFPESKKPPLVDGAPVDYDGAPAFSGDVLQADFGGSTVKLHALGQDHLFQF